MLRLNISRNGPGAVEYFKNSLDKEWRYYSEEKIVALWRGKTARILGLEGLEVTTENFTALVNNRHPSTGKQLTVRQVDNRRAGIELTFNSPKSVSVALALTGDEKILLAHRAAVEAAMAEVEAMMQTQANRNGRKFYDTTGNLIYAGFTHHTSRPVNDPENGNRYVPDPHLHEHAYVPNCTWVEEKKRFQAIEIGPLWTLSPFFESVYHSVLSKSLADAGYSIRRTPDRWELKGISREIIERFSNRTLEIEKVAREKGITDARSKSQLGARTRASKTKSTDQDRLQELWKSRLSPSELRQIHELKFQRKSTPEITAHLAVDKSLEHWLERVSAVQSKRVLATALSYGYGTLTPDQVQKALDERMDIISAQRDSIQYITTRSVLRAEIKMLDYASSTKNTVAPINPHYKPTRDYLNNEQKQAVRDLLSSRNRVDILLGSAGVGKTSLLLEVLQRVEEGGKKLLGFAPSAQASRGVMREKGFENADTVAALLQSAELQKTLSGNVLLIDEAGLISTKEMARLFEIADRHNARVILSGDPKQHNSVNAGDALRQLEERSRLHPIRVETIVRQRNNEPYRQAIQALAAGDTLKGYNRLDKLGAVLEIPDDQERKQALADAYLESIAEKRSALIVSPSHAEGDEITQALRSRLKEAGHLKGEERIFNTKRALSFTESQKQDGFQYHKGQQISFHQNTKGGFRAGQSFTVEEVTDQGKVWVQAPEGGQRTELPLDAPDRFQVYNPTQTPLCQGDLIRITANSKTRQGTRINNGQTYTIRNFTPEGHIELNNGKTLDRDFKDLKHGYVETSFSSQGKDANTVIVAQSALSVPASGERQFYVSTSRGTDRVMIFTDDKAELKKAVTRNTDRISAQEIAEHAQLQRQQRTHYYQTTRQYDYGQERKAPDKGLYTEERKLERG